MPNPKGVRGAAMTVAERDAIVNAYKAGRKPVSTRPANTLKRLRAVAMAELNAERYAA